MTRPIWVSAKPNLSAGRILKVCSHRIFSSNLELKISFQLADVAHWCGRCEAGAKLTRWRPRVEGLHKNPRSLACFRRYVNAARRIKAQMKECCVSGWKCRGRSGQRRGRISLTDWRGRDRYGTAPRRVWFLFWMCFWMFYVGFKCCGPLRAMVLSSALCVFDETVSPTGCAALLCYASVCSMPLPETPLWHETEPLKSKL